jgi:hypothetical protein
LHNLRQNQLKNKGKDWIIEKDYKVVKSNVTSKKGSIVGIRDSILTKINHRSPHNVTSDLTRKNTHMNLDNTNINPSYSDLGITFTKKH